MESSDRIEPAADEKPPGATCNFQGYVQNDTGARLTLSDSGGTFDTQPPMTVAPGAQAMWSGSSNNFAYFTVQYACNIRGTTVKVTMKGEVPDIGHNSFHHSEQPTGIVQVDEGGKKDGWSPRVIWTLTAS
jgi:hypothetical protein